MAIEPATLPQLIRPATQEKKEAKKIPLKTIKHISTPSIKDALSGNLGDNQLSAKQQHEIYSKDDEKEPFTLEELKEKWDTFVARLSDRANLQSTLAYVPEIRENFQLILEIENSVQEDAIALIKPELVSYLRIELKNSLIQLVTARTKKTKGRIIYTDSEKYNEMIKKNPMLALLRQKLNLDLDS